MTRPALKMAARAIVGATAFAMISPAWSDGGDFFLTRPHLVSGPAQPDRPARKGRASARPDMIQIVEQEARRFGVPVEIALYHAKRESGFSPAAKNPASTAKGTLQVIRGSHAAIIGRNLSLSEHLALAGDATHGTRAGMAHIAAAYEARPHWTPDQLWRRCHVAGLDNCGTSLSRAAAIYRSSAPVVAGRFASVKNPYLEVR